MGFLGVMCGETFFILFSGVKKNLFLSLLYEWNLLNSCFFFVVFFCEREGVRRCTVRRFALSTSLCLFFPPLVCVFFFSFSVYDGIKLAGESEVLEVVLFFFQLNSLKGKGKGFSVRKKANPVLKERKTKKG